jgi:uncharacterized membrane protein HdeD (DUF308 family)
MNSLNSVLLGMIAMASLTATVFFLKFWRQTRDALFLFFARAFALDAVVRLLLGLTNVSAEMEPLFYLARLVSFALIIFAVIRKNNPSRRS